jgi:hypothetical protein
MPGESISPTGAPLLSAFLIALHPALNLSQPLQYNVGAVYSSLHSTHIRVLIGKVQGVAYVGGSAQLAKVLIFSTTAKQLRRIRLQRRAYKLTAVAHKFIVIYTHS